MYPLLPVAQNFKAKCPLGQATAYLSLGKNIQNLLVPPTSVDLQPLVNGLPVSLSITRVIESLEEGFSASGKLHLS